MEPAAASRLLPLVPPAFFERSAVPQRARQAQPNPNTPLSGVYDAEQQQPVKALSGGIGFLPGSRRRLDADKRPVNHADDTSNAALHPGDIVRGALPL